MALIKSTLSSDLEQVLEDKPSTEEAATRWATAYASYAQNAMSSLSSLPTNAMGNVGILQGAFSGAFQAQSASGAASAIGAGVMSFWSAIVWAGATAAGSTSVPGNTSLVGTLSGIFSDTGEKSEADKAGEIADAFHTGAQQVMVLDVLTSSGATVTGPIS